MPEGDNRTCRSEPHIEVLTVQLGNLSKSFEAFTTEMLLWRTQLLADAKVSDARLAGVAGETKVQLESLNSTVSNHTGRITWIERIMFVGMAGLYILQLLFKFVHFGGP